MLKIGFSITSIQTHLFAIEELYIKLDTKLTLKAKKIQIFDSKDENAEFDLTQIAQLTQQLKYLYFFFEEIDIAELQSKEQNLSLAFKDGEFKAKHELFSAVLMIERMPHTINARIKELILAGTDANLSMNLSLDVEENQYNFAGTLQSSRTYFDFLFMLNPKQFGFRLDNVSIKDIQFIFDNLKKNNINLSTNITTWVSQRAAAKFYHFDYVQGVVNLGKKFSISELSGRGYASDLSLKLADDIEEIKIPYVSLNLSKKMLDFDFDKAFFNGKNLGESKIFIYDIAQPLKAGISVGIKSKELMLDEKLQALLRHYGIKIPLTQRSGKLVSDFVINIPFSNPANNNYKGNFELENVAFDKANLFVHKGKVRLEEAKLFLDDFKISNEFLASELNASINLREKSGLFDANITKLYFDGLLNMRNQKAQLHLSFKDDIVVDIKDWALQMNFTEGLALKASKLIIFKPYSPILQNLRVSNVGDFTFETKDFNDMSVRLANVRFESDFLKSNFEAYNNDDFFIDKKGSLIKIRTKSGLIEASMQKNTIKANVKNLYYKFSNSTQTGSLQDFNIELHGLKFGILLENFEKTLLFDELDFTMFGDNLSIKASNDEARFDFRKSKKDFVLKADEMNDNFVNAFFRGKMVQNGKFSILIKGDNERSFEGRIVFNETYLTGLRFFNQLISFIDSIPSLVLFKNPTFNEKGLKVKKGVILFTRFEEGLGINALTFNGDSVDILGVGDVDLEQKKLELELELKTLKSASELIAKVPIINQIVLGKNRVISTQILVDGTLDEPKFHSQVVKEALKLPFNMLKNIIEIPASWVE